MTRSLRAILAPTFTEVLAPLRLVLPNAEVASEPGGALHTIRFRDDAGTFRGLVELTMGMGRDARPELVARVSLGWLEVGKRPASLHTLSCAFEEPIANLAGDIIRHISAQVRR